MIQLVLVMSSATVNYDDLYEEFVRLTSSPKQLQLILSPTPTEVEVPDISYEIGSLDRSPLAVLTPPSPLRSTPSLNQQQLVSISQELETSSHLSEEKAAEKMCDSNQVTTSQSTGASSGGNGKQIVSVESNSNSLGNAPSFMSGLLPATGVQQQANLTPVHAHNLGNLGMDSHSQHHQQQPHNLHHSMHSLQNSACAGMQHHHLLDNHHHHVQQHQINLPPQIAHGQSHPHHHPHAHHSPQQYVPFGMHLNANTVGNGAYSNQINTFHHHHGHQIPNQQPAHSVNMGLTPLQQTCFMQHAACMHFQQNSQQLAALTTPRAPGAVSWMNGSLPSTVPVSSQNQNTDPIAASDSNSTNNTGGSIPVQNGGTKTNQTLTPKLQASALPDPTALPGGLEILWRELPVDCQKLLQPQDIPDTARFRGYFTVCELLVLKRTLESRYEGSVKTQSSSIQGTSPYGPLNKIMGGSVSKGEGQSRRGSKRGVKDKCRTSHHRSVKTFTEDRAANNAKANGNPDLSAAAGEVRNIEMDGCNTEVMQEDTDENSLNGELMISLENMKHNIHATASPAVTGVGGAVKEAMEALTSNSQATAEDMEETDNQDSGAAATKRDSTPLASKDSDSEELFINETANACNASDEASSVPETEETISNIREMNQQKDTPLPSMSAFSGIFPERKNPSSGDIAMLATSVCCNIPVRTRTSNHGEKDDTEATETQRQIISSSALTSITGETPTSNVITGSVHVNSGPGGVCCTPVPMENRYLGPQPPYRTATLVLKLLQIGSYNIRSFSTINPNRFRVLFNTQRMVYECQLPVTQTPPPGSVSHAMRKVLTVDIGFEQISMIKFGSDSLVMKVQGAPLLTVSHNAAQDEPTNEILSEPDQMLLDQIDRGQLKLSPIHQLYFLNERLVNSLKSQFGVHPRFRHLMVEASQN